MANKLLNDAELTESIKSALAAIKSRPNYIDVDDPNEVTLHARDVGKTGSKRLETFSAKRGAYQVGDEFRCGGHHYFIDKITDGRPVR